MVVALRQKTLHGTECTSVEALPEYRPRSPETTVLHRVVRDHLETFLADAARQGGAVPEMVERELRDFLTCGSLARGFARVRCTECGTERLVAFSITPPIAPDASSASASAPALVRITHPFHPLLGRLLVRVAERCSRHGDRVWYEAADGSVATIPRAWTDLAAPEPFVVLAGGEALFRPEDLVELSELVAPLRCGR